MMFQIFKINIVQSIVKRLNFLIRYYSVLKELTTNPSTQNGRKETENLYAFGL